MNEKMNVPEGWLEKRELRLEIAVPYFADAAGCAYQADMLADFQRFISDKINLSKGARFDIADEEVDDRPYKMVCPHCKGVISAALFIRDDEE